MSTKKKPTGYITIPKILFSEERYSHLSADAILLYGCLSDRKSLSQKNNWFDQKGDVFIYFSNETVQRTLRCGQGKASKTLKELVDIGLVSKKRQGLGKPDRLYVNPIPVSSVAPRIEGSVDAKNINQTLENRDSAGFKITNLDPCNVGSNNPEGRNPKTNHRKEEEGTLPLPSILAEAFLSLTTGDHYDL